MAPLDNRWFVGPENLPEDFAAALEVASFGYPVAAALGKHGWDGRLTASIGLELTPDNSAVARGQLIMRGRLSEEPTTFQASKLWEAADKEAVVDIVLPSAAEFDFSGGSMHSENLTCDGIKMAATKGDRPILPADWKAHGILRFCLRAIINPAKPSAFTNNKPGVKFSILFFPHTLEEMSEWSDLVAEVGWPGIKVLEGEAPFFPQTPEGSWCRPLLPLIAPGSRFAGRPTLPPGDEIRHVIDRIIDTARQPNGYASHSTLKRRWGKLIADPEDYLERAALVSWPQSEPPAARAGKCFIIISTHYPHHNTHTTIHTHHTT